MGCVQSSNNDKPHAAEAKKVCSCNKMAAALRQTSLPVGLSYHLPTSGPLTPREYRERLACTPGTQHAFLPGSKYQVRWAVVSQRGFYPDAPFKANQDSVCAIKAFGGEPDQLFLGIFDGHGTNGAHCSQFAKDQVPAAMVRDPCFKLQPEQAFHNAMVATNDLLHEADVDDTMSGTTAINAFISGRSLYIANVGDSRAVLAERQGDRCIAVPLSQDQTPFRRDECERVKKLGARVLTLEQVEGIKDPEVECWGNEEEDGGDPPRLWAANGQYPGTAFTRSIGDSAAESIGVFAEPEMATRELTAAAAFLVLASDGVFEFMPSQAVIDMVSKYDDPQEAAIAVVVESYRLWLEYETRTDDISIIIIRFDGLPDHAGVPADGRLPSMPRLSMRDGLSRSSPSVAGKGSPRAALAKIAPGLELLHALTSKSIGSQGLSLLNGIRSHTPEERSSRSSTRTSADIASIEQALKGIPVFTHLDDAQRMHLLGDMEEVCCKAGETVIQEGDAGTCFYVVEAGQIDVVLPGAGEPRVLHTYRAGEHANSAFGELALVTGKPHATRAIARTDGRLWRIEAAAFRAAVAHSRHDVRGLVRSLRSVESLQALSVGQLEDMARAMQPEAYDEGARLVRQGDAPSDFYVVDTGELVATLEHAGAGGVAATTELFRLGPGQYLGERQLLGSVPCPTSVVARTPTCVLRISQQQFEEALGPLQEIINADRRWQDHAGRGHLHPISTSKARHSAAGVRARDFSLADLQLRETLYNTGGTAIALMEHADAGACYTVRLVSIAETVASARQGQALRARNIGRLLPGSPYVPMVLKELQDARALAEVLDCPAATTLATLMFPQPLNEGSVAHVASCLVLALEHLHSLGIVYRGLSAETVVVTGDGAPQLADFRFAKRLALDERTYSFCGNVQWMAPEMLRGQGHTVAADYWALGVLLFFMTTGAVPFSAAPDAAAGCQLSWPAGLMPSAALIDVLQQLLQPDPLQRLKHADHIKQHAYFAEVDWEALAAGDVRPPHALSHRIAHHEGLSAAPFQPAPYLGDMSWLSEA